MPGLASTGLCATLVAGGPDRLTFGSTFYPWATGDLRGGLGQAGFAGFLSVSLGRGFGQAGSMLAFYPRSPGRPGQVIVSVTFYPWAWGSLTVVRTGWCGANFPSEDHRPGTGQAGAIRLSIRGPG